MLHLNATVAFTLEIHLILFGSRNNIIIIDKPLRHGIIKAGRSRSFKPLALAMVIRSPPVVAATGGLALMLGLTQRERCQ